MTKPKAGGVSLVAKRASSVTSKKAVKKATPPKNAKTAKKSVQKKSGGKISIVTKPEDFRKIEIIKNIATRKIKNTPVAEPIYTPQTASVSVFSTTVAFLNNSGTVSSVARYAGTLFVVLGAFFTLYNMSEALVFTETSQSLSAQTTAGTCPSGTDCLTTNTTSISDPLNTTVINQDPKPDVDLQLDISGNTLSGTVPINATVPYADRVDLVAIHKVTNAVAQIGTMSKVSDSVWRTYWRTTAFDDGTYRLKAVVTNRYNTYTDQESTEYIILNHPTDTVSESSDSSETDSTVVNTSSGTSQTQVATTGVSGVPATTVNTAVRLYVDEDEPLTGNVSLRILADGASNVALYVKKTDSQTNTLLGYASLRSNNEWRFDWITTRFTDGEYDLKAHAVFTNGTSNYALVRSLQIQNTDADEDEEVLAPTQATTSATGTLTPNISVVLSKSSPIEGTVDVYVNSTPLTFVELYVIPERSLSPRFLGLAQKISDMSWRYRFDTKNLPNGTYQLFVKARHQYGDSESSKQTIRILNDVDDTVVPENTEYVNTLKTTGEEVEQTLNPKPIAPLIVQDEDVDDTTDDTVDDSEDEPLPPPPVRSDIEEIVFQIEDKQDEEENGEIIRSIMAEFKTELDRLTNLYSKALRKEDSAEIRQLQNELEQLREKVAAKLPYGENRDELIKDINERLNQIVRSARERVERSETIIKERVGDAVTKDSDTDGISDYDEVNLYQTDPFSSDSDNDGFIDGIEVLNGYDPKSDVREANVEYESPKDQGVVREDLLVIEHITTVQDDDSSEKAAPKAHIAGKALPNSFVTLYIFSTPIVVTVKADSSGNWSYIFDKELENGEHEVYVGITDNAGKIVAKSNPLSFIKTAEAFSPIDVEAGAALTAAPVEPSLLSRHALLIVGSLAVVSLGLVLILLGLHMNPRGQRLELAT